MHSTLITPELIEKMKTAKSPRELMKKCKEIGIGLNEKAAKKWFEKVHSVEHAATELSAVAVGGCSSSVKCPKCGSSDYTQRYIPISIFDGTLYCHCNSCGYDAVIG